MKTFLIIICLFVANSALTQQKKYNNFVLSKIQTYNLIKICIDSTLLLDEGLNSTKYLIDVNEVKMLNTKGVDNYFRFKKNTIACSLNILYKYSESWSKFKYFENCIIKFNKISITENSIIEVDILKIKSIDGAVLIKILLKKNASDFKCIESKIIGMS